MNWKELELHTQKYRVALTLNHVFPKRARVALRYFVLVITGASFAASFLDLTRPGYNSLPDGIFFLALSLFIVLSLIEAFYNSSRFANIEGSEGVEFAVAQ